jgi:hypothetical protein
MVVKLRLLHRLRVFENRVLRRIFGSNRDEVMGGWRKLHCEELHNLSSFLSITEIIKQSSMIWAGQVACMWIRGLHIGYWWERDH